MESLSSILFPELLFLEFSLHSVWGVLWVYSSFSQITANMLEQLSQLNIFLLLGTIFLVWGFNLVFWGGIGLLRITTNLISGVLRIGRSQKKKKRGRKTDISTKQVAVVIPAHNEELVIADTLAALFGLVPKENLFVVSDGSKDKTVSIIESFGVQVLDLQPSHGKAGALEECIRHFDLARRFKAVVLVDADTRLHPDYLKNALPFFSDPKVIAVAGYAQTIWNPKVLSWKQMLFVSHRDRVYVLSQMLVKFGQTWKHTNVTHIIPGFASTYRTSALKHITMNPPGLVIEDFNMTFEVHRKELGLVAHSPTVIAYTQDPDNRQDYFRQIKRWHLGFWQTIRHHGFWSSKFWAALALTLVESIMGSIVFLLFPIILILWTLPDILLYFPMFSSWGWLIAFEAFTDAWPFLSWIFWGILVPDYVLTAIVAVIQKRPQYLITGLGFSFVRILDAVAFLVGIPKAFLVNSTGRWVSPTRRVN